MLKYGHKGHTLKLEKPGLHRVAGRWNSITGEPVIPWGRGLSSLVHKKPAPLFVLVYLISPSSH